MFYDENVSINFRSPTILNSGGMRWLETKLDIF